MPRSRTVPVTLAFKILHTADSHIGAGLVARPRHRRARRGDDFVASYRTALALAETADVDLVLHTGDLFDHPHPTAGMMTAAAQPLLDLAVAGIPVVIVPGNHERSAIPASLLLTHPNIHIFGEPSTLSFRLRGQRVAISGFPCVRRRVMEQFDAALAATGWAAVDTDVRILALHQAVDSATCGPANYRFRPGPDAVDRAQIPAAFDLVACGHVHRHQALDAGGVPVVYSGSVDRITFAEADEPKGAVIIEPHDDRLAWSFHAHRVRPMSVWPVDVTDLTRPQLLERLFAILDTVPEDGVAQIRLSGAGPPDVLAGLGFDRLARGRRPHALITLTARDVYRQRPATRPGPRPAAPFGALSAPAEAETRCAIADTRALPPACGVYCLLDEDDRLLYVGKSANLRTRVATHRRGTADTGFFAGWTRRVATCIARRAGSELEALLIEAEMIRAHRPPFNRQMRRWQRYCYLVENPALHAQLELTDRPGAARHAYGPYRTRHAARTLAERSAALIGLAHCPESSDPPPPGGLFDAPHCASLCRRYYDQLCCGPCAGRVAPGTYARLLDTRRRLLTGLDDTLVRSLEAHADAHPDDADPSTRALRSAFEHGRMLAAAELASSGIIVMPRTDGGRTIAVPGARGLRLLLLKRDRGCAADVLAVRRGTPPPLLPCGRLQGSALDCLLTAARQLERRPDAGVLIPAATLHDLTPAGLITVAFGPRDLCERPGSGS